MNPFPFFIDLNVRVGDLNYGNHVGHQHFFLYFHEVRLAYLNQLGFSESDIQGLSLVVAEAHCRYRHELLLGDQIRVFCRISEIKAKVFIFEYQITRHETVCATGTTTCLCLDPRRKRAVSLPADFLEAVQRFEQIR